MTIDEAIQYAEDLGTEEENKIDYDKDSPLAILRRQNTVKDYRQFAEWLTELKEAKRLLKAAVEDLNSINRVLEDDILCMKYIACKGCPFNGDNCYKWRYADEALKLIGEEP